MDDKELNIIKDLNETFKDYYIYNPNNITVSKFDYEKFKQFWEDREE